jgi:hypothetical protein
LSGWYLQIGAQKKGPFSALGLREALRLGEVDPFCDVFHSSNPDLVKPLLEWDEVFDETLPLPSGSGDPQTHLAPSNQIIKVLGSTEQSDKNGLRRSDNLINQTIEPMEVSFDHASAPEYTFLSDSNRMGIPENEQTAPKKAGKKDGNSQAAPSGKGKPQAPSPHLVSKSSKSAPTLGSPTTQDSPHSGRNSSSKSEAGRKRKRIYLVQQGSQKFGPFTSIEVVQQFDKGTLKPGSQVGKGNLATTVPIERFIEVYRSGKSSSFFSIPIPTKWFRTNRLGILFLSIAIGIMCAFFAATYLGIIKKPRMLARSGHETQDLNHRESTNQTPPVSRAQTPSGTVKKVPAIEKPPRPIENQRARNRLSVNPRSKGETRMSAKTPAMVKVAGPSPIAQALMGKKDGSEIVITGLDFDRAAVRSCRAMCEVIFIDTSGAAIQVVFDGATHRNSLFSRSGRVSIVGFLTAGKQKVILKRVY